MARIEETGHALDALRRLTPPLRRFARALSVGRGRAAAGDELVAQAIEAARRRRHLPEAELRASLYGSVVQFNRLRTTAGSAEEPQPRRALRAGVAQDVEHLALDEREALLLVVLERFSYEETASILGLPRSSVIARLLRARATLTGAADDAPAPSRAPHLRVVK